MKRMRTIAAIGLLGIGMITSVAYAQNATGDPPGGEVQAVLLPLIAAATVVERLIEMIFNGYESAVMRVGRIPGVAAGYVQWARGEVRRLQEAFSGSLTPGQASQLEVALKDAENRIAGFIRTPQYMMIKRLMALILGFVFGVLIAYGLDLRMFALLGFFQIPAGMVWLDIIVTGLLIGSGAAPMHSLIGLIQNAKDALDSVRALWKGEALTKAIDFEQTLQEIAHLKERQTVLDDQLRTMGAEQQGAARGVTVPEPPPNRMEMVRRAERLLAK